MAWDNAVVTNNGVALLQQVLSGSILTLDSAAGGTGTVSATALMAQTTLVNKKQDFSLISTSNVTNGKKIKIQVTNVGLTTGYTLNQIGIWAHVGSGSTVMFAILQDSTGIAIPSESEIADFVLSFYAVIDFSNESSFSITIDPSSLVSASTLATEMAKKQNTTDSLTEETALADSDAVPFYDTSAAGHRKTLWSNIKSVLKTYFDTLYAAFSHTHGNITNDGKVGSSANTALYTTTSGAVTSGTLPLAAGGTGQTTALAAALALGRGYGTCATAAATAAKVATLSGFVLSTGAVVGVKFTYASSATAPTLNVNSTGAKSIYSYLTGAAISAKDITAGMTALFHYNGSQWILLNPASVSGGGATHYATLASASWYKGTVGTDLTFWYCYNFSVSDFAPSTQDIMIFPADASSATWFAENGYYDLTTATGQVTFNAASLPTAALNVLYCIFERS